MTREDIEDRYRKWWVGKRCKPVGSMGEFKRVVDVKFTAPPSGVYGVGELIYEDGTTALVGSPYAYKPRKEDVEVLEEEEDESETLYEEQQGILKCELWLDRT